MALLSTEQDLELLYRAHGSRLLRYCTGILGNQADAQDAVQNVFIKAWEKRGSLRQEAAVKSWLYRIAYRTCLDMLRSRRDTEELTDRISVPEEDRGLSEDLREALLQLKPLDRAILEERILDEMSYAQLAAVHHLPQAALRQRYSRARRKLEALLTEDGKKQTGGMVNDVR